MKRALRLRDGCPRPGRAAVRGRGGVCGGTTSFFGEVGRQQAARPPRLPRRKRPTRGAPRVESPTGLPPGDGPGPRVAFGKGGCWWCQCVPKITQIREKTTKKKAAGTRRGAALAPAARRQRRALRKRGALLPIFSLKAPRRVHETDPTPPARKTSAGSPELGGASSLFPSWHRGDGAGEAARGLRGGCAGFARRSLPRRAGEMGQSPKRCKEKGLPSRTLCAEVLACPVLPVPVHPCPPPLAPESLNDSQGVNSPLRGGCTPWHHPFNPQ